METITREIPADCTIIDSGDWHLGALNCHRSGIRKLIKRLADPDVFVVLKGDLVEAIAPNDKRFAHCSQDVQYRTLQDQVDALKEMLAPHVESVLVGLLGNHEWKHINITDVARDLERSLGIPYGGYTCCVQFVGGGKPRFKGFFTHGYGQVTSNAKDPIQRLGNLRAALKLKLAKTGFTDCVYMSMGHIHNAIIVPPTIEDEIMLVTEGDKIKQQYRVHTDQTAAYIPPDARWYASNPSFLKLYSDPGSHSISYGEIAGYGPTELGWLEIDVRNWEIVNVRKVVV